MEEQFILRVPPAVAERIERLLNDTASSSEDKSMDLSFSEDGRTGKFIIGNDHFPASLLDLVTVVESYKTYDDNMLIKTADIGQMIMVREDNKNIPESLEHRHGLTPPMRDARRRRFRREPDLNPEVVRRVEKDLQKIMAGGTVENIDILYIFYTVSLLLSFFMFVFVFCVFLQCAGFWALKNLKGG
ncbi:transcription initiation factor TFIID subunit 7-like [Primulina eburnea]|uniref:transcription initiation factor TFIID subunit 7-like n=1 Tax=Primulina eburnea TaxID=1245227 RepID=UPI003C6CB468